MNIFKILGISIYDLKPRFQALLRPIATRLVSWGITPNQVTIAAISLSLVEGYAIVTHPKAALPLLLLPVVLLVRMALNAIDGLMAKEHDMKTALGEQLNEWGDIVSDLALYAPFLFVLDSLIAHMFVCIFAGGIVLSEIIGMMGGLQGGTRRYDGPMGKSDRALWMSVLAVAIALVGVHPFYLEIYMLILSVLVWITAYNRLNVGDTK